MGMGVLGGGVSLRGKAKVSHAGELQQLLYYGSGQPLPSPPPPPRTGSLFPGTGGILSHSKPQQGGGARSFSGYGKELRDGWLL